MQSDQELMRQFQAGSTESFEKLILKYRVNAEAFARQYVYDPYAAEDITQESFAQLYVNRQRYDCSYSFKTYLFAIIKNKCIDYIRKRKAVSFGAADIEDIHNPEYEYLRSEEAELLRQNIDKLKDDYKTVIFLIEYEEMSYKEAAKIMGKNLAQIKILVFRARQKLKSLLEKEV